MITSSRGGGPTRAAN